MKQNDICASIAALDLDPIKVKLMHEESGEGWTLEYADAVEAEYRRFLHLMKMFPNEQAAPLFDVDVFWHYHILDTMKYDADCQAVFGYFLHHFPYLGLRGEDDRAAHERVGQRMGELYEQTYGKRYAGSSEAAGKSAFSLAAGPSAFSLAASPSASAQAAQYAFSLAAVTSGTTAAAAVDADDDDAIPNGELAAARLYSVRPRLDRSARM